jgi:C4-dicarboxylate transporter DctM subunit
VFWATTNNVPRTTRATLKEIKKSLSEVFWGLGLPAIILGGIYGGVFTPTEAAAVSVIYAAIISLVVYRELDLKGLWLVCVESAHSSGRILILVASASLFSWMLTVTGTTSDIASPMGEMRESPVVLLAFTNALALLSGMFIDVFSNILILVPIILGTLTSAGVGATHLGIIMTVNVDMGNVTPPFGLNLFVASGTFNQSYITVVRAVIPWLCLAIICLLLITYIPSISMWLPSQLYPELT